MLRSMLTTLRQPRYIALSIVMILVALGCIGAGTWQIVRFDDKVHANDALTNNAHASAVPISQVLPLVGAKAPSSDAVRFRTVTATGRYDQSEQGLVRLRSVGDKQGFYVLTPLRTAEGSLLVVRGFVAAGSDGNPPSSVAAAPIGTVTVRARAQSGESKADLPKGLPSGQLASINPPAQAERLGTSVFNGFVELEKGQPGTRGLTVIPPPDLSNPAGGAVEPQHFAYIIQWYLFAALALAAPLAMARSERREEIADQRAGGLSDGQPVRELDPEERRSAKLADRYGRPVR